MTVLVNLTSIIVGTNNEDFNVSNTGWTKKTTPAGSFESAALLVSNAASPNSAYLGATGPSAGYILDAAPGSTTQTVKATIKRPGTITGNYRMQLFARETSGAYISLQTNSDNWSIELITCLSNGNRTTVSNFGSTNAIWNSGNTRELEMRVSGVSPNVQVQCWLDGVQLGSTATLAANTAWDAVGKVGFGIRGGVPNNDPANGMHFVGFYAADDVSGGGSSIAPISMNLNRLRRA